MLLWRRVLYENTMIVVETIKGSIGFIQFFVSSVRLISMKLDFPPPLQILVYILKHV